MGQSVTKAQLWQMLSKYKYALLILLAGLAMMLLPADDEPAQEPLIQESKQEESLEAMLEQILSQIQGAGEVRVLLTRRDNGEVFYQTDGQSDVQEGRTSSSSSTVIVQQDNQELGLIRQTLEPRYRGAIVVCQGADSAAVQLAIVEAVACVTGLGADQISVLKMK